MAKLTEKQLRERILKVFPSGYGTYEVRVMFRGVIYSFLTHNSQAVDMINWEDGEPKTGYCNAREALQALYDECKKVRRLR